MRDETGTRQVWPIRCGEINIDLLREARLTVGRGCGFAAMSVQPGNSPDTVEVLMKYDDNGKDIGEEVATKVARRIAKLFDGAE